MSASSISSSKGEGGFEDQPGVLCLQPDRPASSGQISGSSVSGSASEEEQVVESGPGQQVQMPSTSWTRPHSARTGVVDTFTGCRRGKNENEAPQISDGSSPLTVFLLYFAEIITLLVVET
jgi:hypothetical protein